MISVCVATHNAGEYILPQLYSILSQLSDDDEVIISDDGSSDNTVEKITSLHDKRIHLHHYTQTIDFSEKRLSSFYYASANFYNALEKAHGEIIFLSDQDDIWRKDKVEKTLRYLSDYDIICSNFSVIDESGEVISEHYWENHHFDKLSILGYWKDLPFRGCCLAFKREVLLNAIPFPKKLFLHDCWIGLNAVMRNFKYKFVDDPLLFYRRHDTNVSSMVSPNSLAFRIYYRIILFVQLIYLRIKQIAIK